MHTPEFLLLARRRNWEILTTQWHLRAPYWRTRQILAKCLRAPCHPSWWPISSIRYICQSTLLPTDRPTTTRHRLRYDYAKIRIIYKYLQIAAVLTVHTNNFLEILCANLKTQFQTWQPIRSSRSAGKLRVSLKSKGEGSKLMQCGSTRGHEVRRIVRHRDHLQLGERRSLIKLGFPVCNTLGLSVTPGPPAHTRLAGYLCGSGYVAL